MAFSYSTSFIAPPLSTKFVIYIPPASKPKPKPKPTPRAKSIATTKTAEHSRSGIDSQDSGEWYYTDDEFTMLDSLPTDASHSIGYGLVDAFAGFCGASEPENLEHDQFGGQSLDEGRPDQLLRVAEEDLAMMKLLRGTSRDLPLVVEGDKAEEYYSGIRVEPSSVSDSQEGGPPTSAGNEEHIAVQHGDLDTDKLRTFSIESAQPNSPLAQDEPLVSDIGVTDRLSTTRKRARLGALNVTPELELENPRLTKRRGPVERLAESPTRHPVPTPKPTPCGDVSHSRASTERSLRSLNSDGKRNGAGTPRPSPSGFHTDDDGSHSEHSRRASQGLLPSSIGSISPLKGITGEQYMDPDSERLGENREGSGGGFEKSNNEVNQDDELLPRSSAKSSRRRHKRSNCPLQKERHGSSRTTLGRQSPTRALRQRTSSQPQPLYRHPIDNRPLSCFPRALSPGTKAETNTNHGHGVDMAYQITDLTLCAVPNGSSIVTAVIRYRDSKWPLDPAVLGPKFLGRNSKVIRMTQLSPDSWMLLGYRYDDGASGPCTGRSLKADWMSESHLDATNHETNSSDDDWDEEDGHREQDIHRYSSRTHIAWLPSDEARLLSYKDKQGMEWKEIFERFSDRTTGAVRTRYHKLRMEGQ